MLEKIGEPYPWTEPPKFGHRVRLNSGGPVMLIVDVQEGTDATVCAWQDGEAVFRWQMLKPA